VLSIDNSILNLNCRCFLWQGMLPDLLYALVQFSGPGALLFLVLFDTFLDALRNQPCLFLCLPGTLRTAGNPHGFVMSCFRCLVPFCVSGHGITLLLLHLDCRANTSLAHSR
jgi:hypothetical protein